LRRWDNGGDFPSPNDLPCPPELPTTERARPGRARACRAKSIEVKASSTAATTTAVGLRNRIKESGDEWGVADGLAELDLAEVRHTLTELTEVDAARAVRDGAGDAWIAASTSRRHGCAVYPTARRCVSCQSAYEKRSTGPRSCGLALSATVVGWEFAASLW
jgi:hypothetical protein